MASCIKKSKFSDGVEAVDVPQSPFGVLTRAKALALQKLQDSTTPKPALAPSPEQDSELFYLELRSRRLQKPPAGQPKDSKQQRNNSGRKKSRLAISSGVSASAGSGSITEKDGVSGETQIATSKEDEGENAAAEETCFGENNLDSEGRGRSTRESTPSSLIRDSNAISTPGSSTKPAKMEACQRTEGLICMPSAEDLKEFFAQREQEHLRRFAEKYNFDIVNEKPLDGRYEWVKVQP